MSSKTDLGRRFGAFAVVAGMAGGLAACEDYGSGSVTRAYRPLAPEMLALMHEKDTNQNAPVLIRTYKKEAELEIWKMKADGKYTLLKTYPMCRWSGQLGPKVKEGDRQVPEGFYAITPGQMNPNSAYYLSFNVGYPNAYDRAWNHTGGSIMVHGACSSAGCYSMTDEQIAEIYAVAREGFLGGQRAIQMQSFPFHMTAENFAKYRADPNIGFWKQLKEGSDNFEVTRQEVAVGVCNRHYVFNATPPDGSHMDAAGPCPALKQDEDIRQQVAEKERSDEAKVATFIAQGVRAVRTVYADGGQNPAFAYRASDVSRPDALAQGPIDIPLDEGKDKKPVPPAVQLAAARAEAASKPSVVQPSDKIADATPAPTAAPAKSEGSFFGRFFGARNELPQTPQAIALGDQGTPEPADVPLPPRRALAFAPETTSPSAAAKPVGARTQPVATAPAASKTTSVASKPPVAPAKTPDVDAAVQPASATASPPAMTGATAFLPQGLSFGH